MVITFREDKTINLPGKTSIFVKFNYNKEIVNIIKTRCDVKSYDEKTREWEIPLTSISDVTDDLLNLGNEITFIPYNEETSNSTYYKPLMNYKTKPFEHQIQGIEYGLNHDKWLLLDAPGLGKTLQMTYLAQELKEQKGLEHCLIICGVNSLKENWKREIEKHSDLSCKILGRKITKTGNISYGSIKDRCNDIKNKIDEFFIITNIETLRNESIIESFNNSENKIDMIVVDEFHKAKSSDSKQFKGLVQLESKYKVGLTGTLITNNCLDCYAPLKWLGYERSSLWNFENYYCNTKPSPFNKRAKIIVGYKHLELLKDEVDEISLRRTKDLINLPEKTIINEYVELDEKHMSLYQNMKASDFSDIDLVHIKAKNLLSLNIRFRQAVTCPSLLTSSDIPSSKIERAIDLIDQIISNGEKVVVFSVFKETLKILEKAIKQYKPLVITGDTEDNKINDIMTMFQEDDKHMVLLGTIQKMGTGLTLNRASYAVFIDSAWTASDNLQAEDRVHRIGSKKPVFIYYLWGKDTIDEHIKDVVLDKADLADYMVDGNLSPSLASKLREVLFKMM